MTTPLAVATEDEFATHAELGLMQGFPPAEDKRVDRSNALFGVPYNRWSYQNMRSLYPTADIPTANQPVTIDRKIDGGIDSLSVKRENGEMVSLFTGFDGYTVPLSANYARFWGTIHNVDRKIAIIKQSSQPEASANKYDEFNINAYDTIISYLAK